MDNNNILNNSERFVPNSISASRNIQEIMQVQKGVTGYGTLANLLCQNMDKIDSISKILSEYISASVVNKQYEKQFFDNKHAVKSFWTRNIYLNPVKHTEFENERFSSGLTSSLAIEAGIQLAARAGQVVLTEVDKTITLKEIYSIFNFYANDLGAGANADMAKAELAKIRMSLPITLRKKDDLTALKPAKNIYDLNISHILQVEDKDLIDNICYLLYAISAQKYGSRFNEDEFDPMLLNMYSLLDYNGQLGIEVAKEMKNKYTNISKEETAILKTARHIIKEVPISIPNLNLQDFVNRASEMAKYDPYVPNRKKVENASNIVKKAAPASIAAIFTKRPEFIVQALGTAFSNLNLTDDMKETMYLKAKRDWSMDDSCIDASFDTSDEIKNTANEAKSL